MADRHRLFIALLAGLGGLVVALAASIGAATPGLALAGAAGSDSMRLHVSDMVLDRLQMTGDQVGGREVTVYSMSRLSSSGTLVIERDVNVSAVVPGATDWTLNLSGPNLQGQSVRLLAARSCVRSVGVAGLPLFDGLLDPLINPAVADGFDPNLITEITNLIGSSGLVGVKVGGLWAESPRMTLSTVNLDQLSLTVTPKRVDPAFGGSCVG